MLKILAIFCLIIILSTFFCIKYTNKKNFTLGVIMSPIDPMKKLSNLESIKIYVKGLDVGTFSKEKILKTVEFEIELLQREICIELGKKEFERLKTEGIGND